MKTKIEIKEILFKIARRIGQAATLHFPVVNFILWTALRLQTPAWSQEAYEGQDECLGPQNKLLGLVKREPGLLPFSSLLEERKGRILDKELQLTSGPGTLAEFANGHHYYGLHIDKEGKGVFREWLPNATRVFLVGEFSHWQASENFQLRSIGNGNFELLLPPGILKHGDLYRLKVEWPGGSGERLPAYVTRAVQDPRDHSFRAQVWNPEESYQWKNLAPSASRTPIIYEAHIGMAQEGAKVGTYKEFKDKILPEIERAGYNTIQLMAVKEHPYYGSFGYHVSNFFAPSSRFGTPDDLKELIDEAHKRGITVIMDLVHSHSVKNVGEGLGQQDGSHYQYFHDGERGRHQVWDSLLFDYGKDQVLHFLLSNLKYWLKEFHFDGFRFDGATSMIYRDHGIGSSFDSYKKYFDGNVDQDAVTYLGLANRLVHELRPDAITIAEDVSGMPGIAASLGEGGLGFDYRLSMGVPDYWVKMVKERRDEDWNMGEMFHQLTNRRKGEKEIGYVESHDQAMVGDQTLIFRLLGKLMYDSMRVDQKNHLIDRGMSIHKLARLITFATSGGGYLNFMGNEWGHPEWIDFPRKGNNWSYEHARRQWGLKDAKDLQFQFLASFDRKMVETMREHDLLAKDQISLIKEHNDDKVLAFQRGNLVFIFNFGNRDHESYPIELEEGRYRPILDSNSPEFGGPGGRVTNLGWRNFHLPPRSALVLERGPAQPTE